MVTVDLRLACPLALKLNIHHTMAHRSIFNDPSTADSDSSKQETDSDQASDQVESDNGEEFEGPPPSELAQDELDDDDNADGETRGDGDSEEGPNRSGDHKDTHTTIKPYVGLLASLDRDHNNSLSRHLHSAYLLRRQNLKPVVAPSTGSDPDSDSDRKTKRHKHTELVSDSEEDDDTYQFGRGRRFLTKQWTSWPHPPSYVPRETDPKISHLRNQPRMYYFDTSTYDQPLAPKKKPASSQMLQETLVATFLRFSGDKFRSRPAEETKGVTLALDDDVSQHVLKPVARHVISQLDGLLKGLYYERGYARALVAEDRELAARRSKYLQDKAKGVPWVERRKHKTTARPTTDTNTEDEDSAEERDPDNDDGEGTPPKKTQKAQKSKSTHRRRPAPAPVAEKNYVKRHNRLRLRDWSQVLGVAALTGWEEDALQRTVKRCEGQFDQTMSWRRLKESDLKEDVESGELWMGARLKHPRGEDEDNDGISKDGFMQPIGTRTVYSGGARLILRGPMKKRVRVK